MTEGHLVRGFEGLTAGTMYVSDDALVFVAPPGKLGAVAFGVFAGARGLRVETLRGSSCAPGAIFGIRHGAS